MKQTTNRLEEARNTKARLRADLLRVDKTERFQESVDVIIRNVFGYGDITFTEKLMLNALAINDEAGEVAGDVKKYVWYGKMRPTELKAKMREELGDVLYHVSQLATELNLHLGDIMDDCIKKASERNGIEIPPEYKERE